MTRKQWEKKYSVEEIAEGVAVSTVAKIIGEHTRNGDEGIHSFIS
ncbi:hypothetical protein ACMGD3_08525 [Lysinibacillus sphaericus]